MQTTTGSNPQTNQGSDKTYSPSTTRKPPVNSHEIPGWGIDMPEERRVGVPREAELSPYDNGAHWAEPERQQTDVEILKSVDRPDLTPVFGSTYPPKGLSGIIRRYSYSVHENQRRHWLTLILADRIDVVESLFTDFVFGPQHYKDRPKKVRDQAIMAGALGIITIAGLVAYSRRPAAQERKRLRKSVPPNSLVFAKRNRPAGSRHRDSEINRDDEIE